MSGIKIWELPEATSVSDESCIAVDNGNVTKRISVYNYNRTANNTALAYAQAAEQSATNSASSAATAAQRLDDVNVVAGNVTTIANAVNDAADAAANSATAASNSATSAASAATNSYTYSEEAKTAAANVSQEALLAESWAKGGTGIRAGEDTNNAAYYARQAGASASGGVLSFNGRGGHVMPEHGDYTADKVYRGTSNVDTDLTALEGNMSTAQGNISTLQGNVSTLQSDVSTAQGNITTLQGNMSTAQGDISTLQSDVTDMEVDIEKLFGDIAKVEPTGYATKTYKKGELCIFEKLLYKAKNDITVGNQLVVDGNIEQTTVGDEITSLNNDLTTLSMRTDTNGTVIFNSFDSTTEFIVSCYSPDGVILSPYTWQTSWRARVLDSLGNLVQNMNITVIVVTKRV